MTIKGYFTTVQKLGKEKWEEMRPGLWVVIISLIILVGIPWVVWWKWGSSWGVVSIIIELCIIFCDRSRGE